MIYHTCFSDGRLEKGSALCLKQRSPYVGGSMSYIAGAQSLIFYGLITYIIIVREEPAQKITTLSYYKLIILSLDSLP
jgi:disulfide bond formation protein DsbB